MNLLGFNVTERKKALITVKAIITFHVEMLKIFNLSTLIAVDGFNSVIILHLTHLHTDCNDLLGFKGNAISAVFVVSLSGPYTHWEK